MAVSNGYTSLLNNNGDEEGIDNSVEGKRRRSGDGIALILDSVLPPMIEIVLKYRGYKSMARERRELYAGDSFPTIGDQGAAFSYAVPRSTDEILNSQPHPLNMDQRIERDQTKVGIKKPKR